VKTHFKKVCMRFEHWLVFRLIQEWIEVPCCIANAKRSSYAIMAHYANDAGIVEDGAPGREEACQGRAEQGDREGAYTELAKVARLKDPPASQPRLIVNSVLALRLWANGSMRALAA
jgi:hypothetical protein